LFHQIQNFFFNLSFFSLWRALTSLPDVTQPTHGVLDVLFGQRDISTGGRPSRS